MPRYRIEVRQVQFLTFEIETDLIDQDDVEELFYSMSDKDQDAALVNSDCFEWTINQTHKMEG